MRGLSYSQNIDTHTIHIQPQPSFRKRERKDEQPVILIAENRGGQINIDLEKYEDFIRIIDDLADTTDTKERNKHVDFTEYVRIHRQFISDPSMEYDYEFRISEKEETRNTSHSVYIRGIKQLKLIKDTIIKLRDKYQINIWLEEKIRSEEQKFVSFEAKEIQVEKKYGRLNLAKLGIKKITDVSGLDQIIYLRILNLNDNEIEEIDGLEHLIYLRSLNLGNNYIKTIRGLENFTNLEEISLYNNPISSLDGLEKFENLKRLNLVGTLIPKDLFQEAGIKDLSAAQDIIRYVNNKKENEQNYEKSKQKTIDYIKKAAQVFEELSFSKIMSKTGIKLQDLEEIVEDLIFSGKINAKIRKEGIVFIEENPLIDIALETVDVLQDIKDNTRLISYYTSYIEDVFDKTENIEEFLKSHLASEFEKIRNSWQDYKEGKIDRKEFIKIGIKEVGKKFVKIFLTKM